MSRSIAIYIGKGSLRRSKLTGLDAPSFNHYFDRGENESILIVLRAALGLGLLGVESPGSISKRSGLVNLD